MQTVNRPNPEIFLQIASRIDLQVVCQIGHTDWVRLGSVYFEGNLQNKYNARELKSIQLDVEAQFLRLILFQPQANPQNTQNQVSIV